MGAFFNFLGTVVKTGAVFMGVSVAAIVGFAYTTKPDKNMLKDDIEQSITSNSNNIIEHTTSSAAAKIATGTAKINVKDYIVAKTADVTFVDGTQQSYIGAFQNWIPVNKLK